MSFAYSRADGTFRVGSPGRDALVVPEGRMLQFLPDEVEEVDNDRTYPDLGRGRMYTHTWSLTQNSLLDPPHAGSEVGRAHVTALPGAWSATGIIAAVPPGCNLFEGEIMLTRTVAPTHNWLGADWAVLSPTGKWLKPEMNLLEAGLGFLRALYIYISDGNLIWHMQQSLAAAPGGYGNHPGTPGGEPAWLDNPYSPGANRNGGETVHNGTAGWPVYYPGDTGAPHYRSWSGHPGYGFFTVYVPSAHRASGSSPPSISDPTNYGASWRFTLRGRFGRRT